MGWSGTSSLHVGVVPRYIPCSGSACCLVGEEDHTVKKQGPICVGVDVCVFVLVFGSLELRMALDENLTHLLLLCHTVCRFFFV